MRRRSLAPLYLSVLVVCLSAAAASAATIVPMSDQDLALSARAVVEGRIVHTEPVWSADRGAVVTYVTVDVERVLKGDLPPGLVVLAQPGGRTERHETVVSGAPDLRAGSRALLFLNTDRRGALHVAHMSIGHYEITADAEAGVDVAHRPGAAAILSAAAARGAVTDAAPLAELESAVLATVAANPDAVARYEAGNAGVPLLLAPPEYAPVAGSDAPPAAAFTFLAPGFRWFEPDIGKAIRFSVNERGAATPSHGVDESRAAFAAWSRVSGSSLKVAYDGRSSGGGHRVDGHNQIAFGDPLHEIDDPVNCTGVVASGGVTAATSETVTVGGKQFSRIVEGDVVVNNGFDCLLSNSTVLSEVLTHELGHALGFGHSSEQYGEPDQGLKDATMYFVIHNDGRGASLRVDDSEGARALYPRATTAAALELASTAVPDGLPGRPYAAELRATGGRTPYVWTLSSGVLPPGLTLAQDGRISGDAPEAGAWRFGVSVRDADGTVRTQSLEMRVTGAPAPFLARARYNPTAERLAVAGLYLASSATISINGSVVPSSVRVKYSSTGERLSVFGSGSRLRLRASGSNTLVVTYDGRASNTLTF